MISFREQGAAYSCDEWLRPLCWNRRSLFLRVLNLKSPSLALYLDVCTFYHIATLYLSVLLSWCCNIKHNFWRKGMMEPRVESFSFLEYFNFNQKVIQISIVRRENLSPSPLCKKSTDLTQMNFTYKQCPTGTRTWPATRHFFRYLARPSPILKKTHLLGNA